VAGRLPEVRLGASGLPVTAVGLGLAALGRPAYITADRDRDFGTERDAASMERRTHSVLDAAYDLGVRYVDAARSYGRAEEFLASWLRTRRLGPGDITVGSKWGYRYVGDWRMDAPVHEVKDHSIATFLEQRRQSSDVLGAHLRLYQVHSATIASGVLEDERLLGALAETAESGVAIGLTTSGPAQSDVVRRALEVDVDGVNPFTCVQATWNVLEPSAGLALSEAHDAGWGVLVKEVFANGRLTRPADAPAALNEMAGAQEVPPGDVALAAALAQPWADVVLTGAVTKDQVGADVDALSLTLSDAELVCLATLAEPADRYWSARSSLPWR